MEGLLELRPPGIMGKWEERYFRLDYDSLKCYSSDGRSMMQEFVLDQIENINLEAPELNFLCQGRKSRLRGSDVRVIQEWHSKLQQFVQQGANPSVKNGFQDDPIASRPGAIALKVTSPENNSTTLSPQVAGGGNANKSRVDMMYEAHKRKLEKLQEKRDREAEEEKKRLHDEFQATRSKTTKGRGKISQAEVNQTADRLFSEHRIIKENLEKRRLDYERQETDRIADNRRMNLPTRQTSDPAILTAREAGDRLYSDAERRELWRTQARDAQAKEELTMVRIGVKGASSSSTNRCHDLHKEANSRKDKLDKAVKKKLKEDDAELIKDAVPCGDGKRGANMVKLHKLYEDHAKRQEDKIKEHAKKVEDERKDLEKNMVAPTINKAIGSARRTVPPWKDANYPFNLPKKGKDVTEDKSKLRVERPPTSHADYSLVAIQASISLRSGYSHFQIPPSLYKKLHEKLKKMQKCYTNALHSIQQDPGFASLCSRPSQRLFQEHLLPEIEGWSHRLEPDPIRQVEDNLEALLSSGAKAHEVLKSDVAPGAPWAVGSMRPHPTGVPTALWALDPGVKTQLSAETKALVKYGPGEGAQRYRHLTDISRLQLVFSSCDMLQAGLEHILKRFEVVDVRNYCSNPGRLGRRYVEVLVVVIVRDGREQVPHVCELRLEPLHFHNATKRCTNVTAAFYTELSSVYQPTHMDLNAIECITRHTLNAAPEGHRLRSFRCHLGRRFGSSVCGWRRALGGGRLLNFQRFREVCYSLNCGEHVTELWQELDPNRGGCISLWELDMDAVSVLVKLRTRMLAVLASHQKGDVDVEETDANVLFARLTSFVRPIKFGSLEQHEFRLVAKPLGLSQQEADKAFACLDRTGTHAPPASIDVTDIQWLKKLPMLVDIEGVACAQDVSLALQPSSITGGTSPADGLSSPGPTDTLDQQRQDVDSGSSKKPPAKAAKDAPKQARPSNFSPPSRGPVGGAPASKTGLSDMGVDMGASSPGPDKASIDDPGDLGELGVDVEDDDDEEDDYDEEEEEEEDGDEDEEDDEDGAPDGEETW